MTTLIVILAIVAIIVVAVVALAVGFAEGCKYGYLVGLQARIESDEMQDEGKTPDYERGYRDALADYSRSLINWN